MNNWLTDTAVSLSRTLSDDHGGINHNKLGPKLRIVDVKTTTHHTHGYGVGPPPPFA